MSDVMRILRYLMFPALAFVVQACEVGSSQPELILTAGFDDIRAQQPVSITFDAPAGKPVLVTVNGFELQFESKIYSDKDKLLNRASLPYLRTLPIYQYLPAQPKPQTYRLEIYPVYQTRNAAANIEVVSLPLNNGADDKRATAYRLYSQATQTDPGFSAETWRPRVEELKMAAALFEDTGQQEQQLYAGFLVAYFKYFPLSESSEAFAMLLDINPLAERGEVWRVLIPGLQLQGQTLVERNLEDSPESARKKLLAAQELYKKAAQLATAQGQVFQQVWANNNRGIAYYYAGEAELALQQYEQALVLAAELQDDFLIRMIRSNRALALEINGDIPGALESLESVVVDVRKLSDAGDLVYNLSELGRVYHLIYRFPDAIKALTEAMRLSEDFGDNEQSGHITLSLGRAYYGMGYMQRANNYLEEAISHLATANYGRGLRTANRILANIARFGGQTEKMKIFRNRQDDLTTSKLERIHVLYERGLDSLSLPGQLDTTKSHFMAAYKISEELNNRGMMSLSQMQLCNLNDFPRSPSGLCANDDLRDAHDYLLERGSPSQQMDAMLLWSKYLSRQQMYEEAILTLDHLTERVRYYRTFLPGVLGAWYWQSRRDIFQTYLGMVIEHDLKTGNGEASLLLLDRLKNIELSASESPRQPVSPLDGRWSSQVRNLIARRDRDENRQAENETEKMIDALLLQRGQQFSARASQNTADRSGQWLNTIPSGSVVLAYYFSKQGVYTWLADSSGVSLQRLPGSDDLAALLTSAGKNLRVIGYTALDGELEALGESLVESLHTSLPETIYLLPTGPMTGFPFEALRVNGRFIAQDHAVINLMTLDGATMPAPVAERQAVFESVFIGGNPDFSNTTTANLAGSARELDTIKNHFNTADVVMASGADFNRAAFTDPFFQTADLIHLSSHASVDLDYPELSRLLIAGDATGGDQYLTPSDVLGMRLQSKLVVLSACETSGTNRFEFDSNLGFVTEFLQAGSESVMASLWPVRDRQTAEFMEDFYRLLAAGRTPADALVSAKRKFLLTVPVRDWSAFQLMVQ